MSITIEFEDLGQDFLVWTLNENGVVIECKPFQAWLWKGRQVVDYASLKRGHVVHLDLSVILWAGHIMRCKSHGYADEEEKTNRSASGSGPRAAA